MSRVRVLHLVVGGEIGGAERLLADLATRAEATVADHSIALFTPNPALQEYFTSRNVHVHSRGFRGEGPWDYLVRSFGRGDVAWLSRVLHETQTQVLHTHTFGSHVLGTRAARRAQVPQLRTEHEVVHYGAWDRALFTRWAASKTERFAAVSDFVLRALQDTSNDVRARGCTVRNGISTDYFRPSGLRNPGPHRVAVVCRLTKQKRIDLAIRAASLAKVALTVVGDGEERPRLTALSRRLSADVTFVGHVNDPRPYVESADIVLSTAKDEPFGLSIVEALSLERPVVVVRGGGVTESVEHGVSGLVVEQAHVEDVAAAMRELFASDSRRHEMGKVAREFAIRECNVLTMCERYARIYRSLAGA